MEITERQGALSFGKKRFSRKAKGEMPTANGQWPMANGQRPMANGQRPMANGQRPTARRPTASDEISGENRGDSGQSGQFCYAVY